MVDQGQTEVFASAEGAVRWNVIGSGEPVVLSHGTPFSSYVWREIAPALADRYRVYTWDMPGYGASEQRTGQHVSLAAQGRVFAALLAHWGLDRPRVVAHDFGGAVALRAHLLHHVPYSRLALVGPVAVAPWGSPFFRLVGGHTEVFEQLPAALHRALVTEYVRSASATGLMPHTLEALVAPWLGPEGQPAFYRQIRQADQAHTDEIQDSYGELDLPVLLTWGEADAWIPPERFRDLATMIPGVVTRPLDGAGHLVQLDAPARLTAALLAFLGT
ncbi:alpha/beta fold hydrolase [Nocardiopsis sp. MG754419]|uniref:alpha/beta fold hydrolase n=1 Tax=Nocardiopsis sp. MG754419 TaxID=2259865 RepID=UPI001BACE0DB|nr:alpha/beta hydrolase [Nocardiopsis sp. MG754419]MBR8743059.1 alpha/beta hydrolase [Nocardiopsis sp. MG754419]